MLRVLVVFLGCVFCTANAWSQDRIFDEARGGIFNTDFSFAGALHTAGWTGNYRYSKYKGAFKKRILEIEFTTIKHPKEYKSYNPFLDNNIKGYIYGKKNSFWLLRPSFLLQNTIFKKQSSKGVAVSYIMGAGPVLGLLKPVYLEIGKPTYPYEYIALEKYDEEIHYIDNIVGRGPWYKGIDETNILPGAHAKLALEFDYCRDPKRIKAVEVGGTLDVFHKNADIMAFTSNRQVFFNLYVAVRYGARKMLE